MSASDGATAGTTVLAVTEALTAGHTYVIKAYATNPTLPTFGQDLSLWDAYTEGAEFATTNNYYVVVAEVTADGKAVKVGVDQAVIS